MKLKCIYHKTNRRNEKTGYTYFTVTDNGSYINCAGVIPSYLKHMGLTLEGEYDENAIFQVSDFYIEQYDTDSTIDFICSKVFTGTGPMVADEIMRKTELDPYKYVRGSIDAHAFKKAEISVINRLAEYVGFEKVYSYLKQFGATYYDAKYVYENYGKESSIAVLNNNPYILTNTKMDFSLSEKMAKDAGIKEYDRLRTAAVVKHAMHANSKNGNTYITFHGLCKLIEKIDQKSECGFHTDPLYIAEEILSQDYVLEETSDDEYKIYLAKDYNTEKKISDHIRRLNENASKLYDIEPYEIREIENQLNIEYSTEQKRAFNCLNTSGIKIITGGPGTGKTTLLNGILKYYDTKDPFKDIWLCAPTGCAARRMAESTGIEAYTIHKLLEIKPYEYQRESNKRLSGVIVVDESSMVDMDTFLTLLSSIETGSLLIMMGDANQLPPVGSGNIFKDMISANVMETYRLITIFRQKKGNSIIYNSYSVLNGLKNGVQTDESFSLIRCSNSAQIKEKIKNYISKLDDNANYKVYTSCRKSKFETSTVNINRMLQKEAKGTSFEYGFNTYSVGDHVIFTKNNYDKSYYNGQEGIITYIQNQKFDHFVTIRTEDDEEFTISGFELDDIELSYAITAHKSQGSECETAIIALAKEPVNMLKRQLLYVEITRAKKNVVVFSENNAWEICASSYGEIPRNTNLKDLLVKQ